MSKICMNPLYAFVLFVFMLQHLKFNKAERRVIFKDIECNFNPKHFSNFTASVKNNTLNLDMYIIKPIVNGFKASVEYQLRLANAKSFQSIFNHKFDVCALVSSVKDSLLKNWFKDMTTYGNFMLNCPVEVGHYYLKDWRIGSTQMHSFLYPGEYRSVVKLFYGKINTKSEDHVLTFSLDAQIFN